MTLGETIRDFLFGSHHHDDHGAARKEWRSAVHDNRNAAMRSVACARQAQKSSDKAARVAEEAVIEIQKNRGES